MRYRDFRWPCDFPARAEMNGRIVPVRIVNVNDWGARIEGLGEGPAEGMLRLIHGQGSWQTRVSWRRATVAGLRFLQRLSPRDLAYIRQSGAHAGWGGGLPNHGLRELR